MLYKHIVWNFRKNQAMHKTNLEWIEKCLNERTSLLTLQLVIGIFF